MPLLLLERQMTTKEICKRLTKIRDDAIFNHGFIVGAPMRDEKQAYCEMMSALRTAYEQLSDLVLDIASSKPEEADASAPKKEPCTAGNSMRGLSEKQYKSVWAGALRYGMTEKQADELIEAIKQNERMKQMYEEIEKEENE
jgi:hypothetical protein